MLIQFTVENFLSFREKSVFSTLATSDTSHPEHVVELAGFKRRRVLRCAAIYGANASGKSNLVKAMSFARNFIVEGTESGEPTGVTPFKGSADSATPSSFQFVFSVDELQYTYGFALDNTRILEEYLYVHRTGQRLVYFERRATDEKSVEVRPGPTLLNLGAKTRSFLEYKAADTRANQLFLSSVFEGNLIERLDVLQPVMSWFQYVLTIIEPESFYSRLALRTHTTEALKSYLGSILDASGTGIKAVNTKESKLEWDRDLPGFPVEERESVRQKFRNLDSDTGPRVLAVEMMSSSGELQYIRQGDDGELLLLKLSLQHDDGRGGVVEFRLDEESDGTQRIIHLAPMLYELRAGQERVLVIDELDRRLHPHLTRMMVETAMRCKFHNQLIFTTHDTNLLDTDVIRRDEIWFVEKKSDGASQLYSLSEFRVRPDLQIQKGYLNGRFGAIPFLGDISSLGWLGEDKHTNEELVHG